MRNENVDVNHHFEHEMKFLTKILPFSQKVQNIIQISQINIEQIYLYQCFRIVLINIAIYP
jgi:hypothetical protein